MSLILSKVFDEKEVLSSQRCRSRLSKIEANQSLIVFAIFLFFKMKSPVSFKIISTSALLYLLENRVYNLSKRASCQQSYKN